jgi:hypothetical protein
MPGGCLRGGRRAAGDRAPARFEELRRRELLGAGRFQSGPTPYPLAVTEAFVEHLAQAGVTEHDTKLHVSDIPLRH